MAVSVPRTSAAKVASSRSSRTPSSGDTSERPPLATAVAMLIVPGDPLVAALGLATFGGAALAVGDSLVLPALVGEAAQLPFLLVLIVIVGGMQSFGLLGLFLGPVIMAALLSVWREWIDVGD